LGGGGSRLTRINLLLVLCCELPCKRLSTLNTLGLLAFCVVATKVFPVVRAFERWICKVKKESNQHPVVRRDDLQSKQKDNIADRQLGCLGGGGIRLTPSIGCRPACRRGAFDTHEDGTPESICFWFFAVSCLAS
jgi:hypothetical protein